MTAAVGMDSGAESEVGGMTGLAQGPAAARLGKEVNANRIGPASGNRATDQASATPSFRLSWQSQVNAWQGVSRATAGVENEDESETGTVDVRRASSGGRAANDEQSSRSAQAAATPARASCAITQQSVPAALAHHEETSPQASGFAWNARQNALLQTTTTENAGTTAIERPGTANRNRADAAAQQAGGKSTAKPAAMGEQTVVAAAEVPVQIPPVQPPMYEAAQNAGTMLQESAQLSAARESTAAATGGAAGDSSGSSTVRGLHTQAAPAHTEWNSQSATGSAETREIATSVVDDCDEPVTKPQMAAPDISAAHSAGGLHAPSAAGVAAGNENGPGESIPRPAADILAQPGPAQGAAASFAANGDAVQGGADAAEGSAAQWTGRAMQRAANRSAAGETARSTATVAASQQDVANAAASSGLGNAATPHSSTAIASGQQTAGATSVATTVRDMFSALDAEASPGTPTWTHAGGQHAEAGFRDPALGWIGVRAELNTDGVHATLVPSSTEAAQALNGHLTGLSSHLTEQQSPVASLTMASPAGSGNEKGADQSMQQGAEGNARHNAPGDAPTTSPDSRPQGAKTSVPAVTPQSGVRDSFAYAGDLRGTRISVMA